MCKICALTKISLRERWPKPLEALIKEVRNSVSSLHQQVDKLDEAEKKVRAAKGTSRSPSPVPQNQTAEGAKSLGNLSDSSGSESDYENCIYTCPQKHAFQILYGKAILQDLRCPICQAPVAISSDISDKPTDPVPPPKKHRVAIRTSSSKLVQAPRPADVTQSILANEVDQSSISASASAPKIKITSRDPVKSAEAVLKSSVEGMLLQLELLEEQRSAWWRSKSQLRKEMEEACEVQKLTNLQKINNSTSSMIQDMVAVVGVFAKWRLGMAVD